MQISIVCVGKIKEAFYRDAIAEYSKRLSRYCKLNIIELADGYMAKNYPSKPYWLYLQNDDNKDSLIVTMFDINNIETLMTKYGNGTIR